MSEGEYLNEYTNCYWYIHIITGAVIAIPSIPIKYRISLFVVVVLYQFGQLMCNIRYFVFENRIRSGNSIKHTLRKIKDHVIGFIIIRTVL